MAHADVTPTAAAGPGRPFDRLRRVTAHPTVVGLVFGGVAGLVARDVFVGLAVGILMAGAAWAFRIHRGSMEAARSAIVDALTGAGATHVGYSASDRTGIGYDAAARSVLVAHAAGGVTVVENCPLDKVREVTWSRPAADPVPLMALHNPSALIQANAANAADARRARQGSGLRIETALSDRPAFVVGLDADARRMQAWTDLIRDAREGKVRVPDSIHHL